MAVDWSRWLPLIFGGASGAAGWAQGRAQQNFANQAGQPRETSSSRQPWAPTVPFLDRILQDALGVYEHQRGFRPPPQRQIGGQEERGALAELAARARQQALSSQFIPQAQGAALGLMQGGAHPLLMQAFQRASSFTPTPVTPASNPWAQQLLMRLLGGGGGAPGLGGGGAMVPGVVGPGPFTAPHPAMTLTPAAATVGGPMFHEKPMRQLAPPPVSDPLPAPPPGSAYL